MLVEDDKKPKKSAGAVNKRTPEETARLQLEAGRPLEDVVNSFKERNITLKDGWNSPTATTTSSSTPTGAEPVQVAATTPTTDNSKLITEFYALQAATDDDANGIIAMQQIFDKHKNGAYSNFTAAEVRMTDPAQAKFYKERGYEIITKGTQVFAKKEIGEETLGNLQKMAIERENVIVELMKLRDGQYTESQREQVEKKFADLENQYITLTNTLNAEHQAFAQTFAVPGTNYRYNEVDGSIITAEEYDNNSTFSEYYTNVNRIVSTAGSQKQGIEQVKFNSYDFLNNKTVELTQIAQQYYGSFFTQVFDNALQAATSGSKEPSILEAESKLKVVEFAKGMSQILQKYPDNIINQGNKNKQYNPKQIFEELSKAENPLEYVQKNAEYFQNAFKVLSPEDIRLLEDAGVGLFDNKEYYSDPKDYQNYQNNKTRYLDNITQWESFRQEIFQQAQTQFVSKHKNDATRFFESITEQRTDGYNYDKFAGQEVALKAFFAEHLLDDNGRERSLDQLMRVFMDIFEEETELGKQKYEAEQAERADMNRIFSETYDLKQPETAESTGTNSWMTPKMQEESYIALLESAIKEKEIRGATKRQVKKVLKEYNELEGKLDSDIVYIPEYDNDGNIMGYQKEQMLPDGDVKGLGLIVDPKEVKNITKLLEKKEINEKGLMDIISEVRGKVELADVMERTDPQLLHKQSLIDIAYYLSSPKNDIELLSEYKAKPTITDISVATNKITAFIKTGLKGPRNFFTTQADKASKKTTDFQESTNDDMYVADREYYNLTRGTEGDLKNYRHQIYKAYGEVVTDYQRELSKVSIEGLYKNSLTAGLMDINEDGTGGNAGEQAFIIQDPNINPKTESPKAQNLNLIIENLPALLQSNKVSIREGKIDNVLFVRPNNRNRSSQELETLNQAYENAVKVDLEFLPYTGNNKYVGYGLKLYDADGNVKTFGIHADKQTMITLKEARASNIVDPDRKILMTKGEYNFSSLDAKGVTDNRVTLTKNQEIIWHATYNGQKKTINLSEFYDLSDMSIDEIQGFISGILEDKSNIENWLGE